MRIIPSLFLFLMALTAFASEKPEQIQFKTKVIRPAAWYAKQADLWAEALREKSMKEGWINYYLAAKYAQQSGATLQNIVDAVKKVSPDSFEANLIAGMNLGYTEEGFILIDKAFALDPQHPALSASLVLMNEYKLDAQKRKQFSETLWRSNQISSSLLSYSYNVLMSLENNGVLFTEGENTTLPIFVLQDIFNIRPDVQVLNLDMMLNSTYRERKLKQVGLDLRDYTPMLGESDKRNLCGLLPAQNTSQKFYYSLTLSKQNISTIKDQLYVVGLASQMSPQRMDNISQLKENLENRFLLDHLAVDFDGEPAYASGKILSVNYLVPMLLLSEHYISTGEKEKLGRWEKLITTLASEHGKTVEVQNFLNREKSPPPFVPANLNLKALESSLRVIRGNIYAFKNELTNDDYNFFLKYLQDNKQDELYERSKIDLSQYTEPALSFMKAYHTRPLTKKEKAGYPAVNISYEGALAYCDWLTEQYNRSEKRKYKKVKFRLPSVNEWQIAALGYDKFQSWNLEENMIELAIPKNDVDEICKGCSTTKLSFKESDILYPWYGAYNYRNKALNRKGCALGNFKWPENHAQCLPNIPAVDGFIAMSPVESYFPNNIGLYDVVGNVAEMTSERGKACGGSWNHKPEESTIQSINTYDGPDAAIGFRVFMEIIEQ